MSATRLWFVPIALLAGTALAGENDDLLSQVGMEHAKYETEAIATVTFGVGSASLTPRAQSLLATMAQQLASHTDSRFEVAGHTDSSGAERYNERLADERAEAVRTFLVSRGVASDRLITVGYGPFQPIGQNESDAGRAQNRRVDLRSWE